MSLLARVYDSLLAACLILVGLLFLALTVLVSADVIGRYLFASPIPWVLEVAEHLLAATPFLGMAWLVRRHGGHIRVDVLVQSLPLRGQAALDGAIALVAAVTCAVAAYYAGFSAMSHYERNVMTYGLYPVPKFWIIGVICAGLAFTAIEFLRKFVERLRDYREASREHAA